MQQWKGLDGSLRGTWSQAALLWPTDLAHLHQKGMDSNQSTGLTQGTRQGKETWRDVLYLVLLPFKVYGTVCQDAAAGE